MGRMSCYTGQSITWENALNSTVNLMPENLAMDMRLPGRLRSHAGTLVKVEEI